MKPKLMVALYYVRVGPYMKLLLFIFKRKSEDAARNSSKLEVKASFLPFEPYWRV